MDWLLRFVALLAHAAASASQFGLTYVPPPVPPGRINDIETEATVDANESESSTTGLGIQGERPSTQRERTSQEGTERHGTARIQVSFPVQAVVATGPDETNCHGPNLLTTERLVGRATANKILWHRLAGTALIGLAWSACQTGYVFLGETSWIFWTFVSTISALVLLVMAIQNEGERLPGDY